MDGIIPPAVSRMMADGMLCASRTRWAIVASTSLTYFRRTITSSSLTRASELGAFDGACPGTLIAVQGNRDPGCQFEASGNTKARAGRGPRGVMKKPTADQLRVVLVLQSASGRSFR